ncbi:lytic transglycosylase domain-containing protein [Paenibacillus sediminis]|uniref:Soluble lytic murein transglycosylase n=1 Tax=Paenibacillus sediminis TaxID=664909 RepID=A0ABS4H6C5_9BACL|nr:lytic transglycosylase domain-containing protein [Paenibacillus sediminis]MBP1937792.1 soluble lytic murein transglycosylase [Paenibacillus sediminis]
MKLLRKKRTLLLLFLTFVLVLFFNSNWMSLFYPIHYKEEIQKYAQKYNVDPFLVASIIRVESNYKTSKESKKGALGIMQVMPDTARWVVKKAKFHEVSLEQIKDEPDTNIQIGAWYLALLQEQFGNNKVAVIAAYNAGPGNVNNWLKKGIWDGTLESVQNIPIGETRHYVQRVIYYYNQYTDIYEKFGAGMK